MQAIVGFFQAHRDDKLRGHAILVLRIRLRDLCDEMLVEVWSDRVRPVKRGRRILVAVGVGPVVPDTGAEDAPAGFVTQRCNIADVIAPFSLSMALVAERAGQALFEVLLVPVTIGGGLVFEAPAVAQLRLDSQITRSPSGCGNNCSRSNRGLVGSLFKRKLSPNWATCPRLGWLVSGVLFQTSIRPKSRR